MASFKDFKNINVRITFDTEDPLIKAFIEAVHKSTLKRLEMLNNRTAAETVLENRVLKIYCADKYTSPSTCAEQLSIAYGYNLRGDDVIKIFKVNGVKTREERMDFLTLSSYKVEAFAKALCTRDKNDYEEFDNAHLNLVKKFRRNIELEKLGRRIFYLTLYTKYPELNIYNDADKFELFGKREADSLYRDIFEYLKNIIGIKSKNQRENEQLRNALQIQANDMKNLNENFEAQVQDKIEEFFSSLNSDRYGNILDAIISTYGGIQQLRKQKVEVPLEISDLFPLVNNLKKFVIDNEINPIARVGSVQMMTKADIEKISGEYSGTPFIDADEVKKVRVISPGWYYKTKDVQISRPRLKEETDETDE